MGQRRKKLKTRRPQAVDHQPIIAAVAATASAAVLREDSKPIQPAQASVSDLTAVDYGPMGRDLRKLLVVVVLVLGVLAGLIVTNRSSGWLNREADRLSHWLQLS